LTVAVRNKTFHEEKHSELSKATHNIRYKEAARQKKTN